MTKHASLNDIQAQRQQFLLQSLKHVATKGWTDAIFSLTAIDLKQDPSYGLVLFPSGIESLVDHYFLWCDDAMLAALKGVDLTTMRVQDRIKACIKFRIKHLTPYKRVVGQTFKFFARPWNKWQGIACMGRTANLIWRCSGDESTDFNYYTKRILVSGVYGSTLLFWLSDHGKGAQKTMNFLDNRIDNVLMIGKQVHRSKQFISSALSHVEASLKQIIPGGF